jgi:hypothetical protein
MKALLAALIFLSSTPAFADYFGCELKVGYFNKAEVEAEYRVLNAEVTLRPFKCEGHVDKNGFVVTTISSTEIEHSKSASDRGRSTVELTSLDIWGDGQDTGVCSCGMQ